MPRIPGHDILSAPISGKSDFSSDTDSESESESESEQDGRRSRRRAFISVEEALKPLHPSIKPDSNSWPCFALLDANVYLKDGVTIVNLLEAETAGPFVLTGRLDLDEDDEYYHYLRKSQYQNSYVKIENISGYSFGERSEDLDCREAGHAIIWAGSEAFGWFEISPSVNYEPHVIRMTTAINAYWFLQRFYRKKRVAAAPIEEILARYAVQAEGTGHTRHEAEGVLRDHASFLISQMRRKEGVNFEKTTFWSWLVASSPSTVAALQKLNVAIVLPKLIPSAPLKFIPPPPQLDHETTPSMRTDNSGYEDLDDDAYASIANDDVDTDAVDRPKTNAEWIIWLMNEMVSSGEHEKARISAAKVWYKVFLDFTCVMPALAREIVRVHAAEIRAKIGTSWRNTNVFKELGEWDPLVLNDKDSPEWREKAFHHVLRLRATQPLVQGRPREKSRRYGSGADATNQHHSSESLLTSESHFKGNYGPTGPGRRTRGSSNQGLAPLEPLTTKAAIKARVDAERENITSGEGFEPPSKKKSRSRLAGKVATLHPPGSKKRMLSAAPEEDADHSHDNKRTRSSVSSPRASSETSRTTSSHSNDPFAEDDHPSPSAAGYAEATTAYKSSTEDSGLDREVEHQLLLSSTPIHTLHANTRNGGWKCDLLASSSATQTDCHFAIYDITVPSAQAAFTQHCYDHASGILASANLTSSFTTSNDVNASASASRSYPSPSASLPRVAGASGEQMARLVEAEAAKTGHQVSHLVEKLMELNRREREAEEAEVEVIGGKKVPKRIKRFL